MEDGQIIRLLKKRPPDGLREAIAKYRGLVGMVVNRVLSRYPQDAEECIADAFVKVWKESDRLREDGNLRGLLVCAARNLAIDRWRNLCGRDGVPFDDELDAEAGGNPLDSVTGGDEVLLRERILEMPQPDREIFIRKYYFLESVRQIALRLGLVETQVKNRLYRGRQRLRRELEERGAAI